MFVSPLLRALQTAVCITAGRRRVHVQQAPALWASAPSLPAAGAAQEVLSSTDEEGSAEVEPVLPVFVCPWLRELRGTRGDTAVALPARSTLPLPLWTAVRWLPAGWCMQEGGQGPGQVNVRHVRQVWAGEQRGTAAEGAGHGSSARPTERETRASLRHRIGAARAAVRLYAEQHRWQLVVLVCHAHVMREFGMPAIPSFLQTYETWL